MSASSECRNQNASSPLIIVDRDRNQVVQLNDLALAAGVAIGMGLAMAISMSSEIKVLEYKPSIEEERLNELAHRLYHYTADIALDPPQGLFLRIDNMLRLYESVEQYCEIIGKQLTELNLNYSYGVAPVALMAKLIGLTRQNQLCVDYQTSKAFISALSIEALALSNKQKEQLSRVGLKTVGDLLQIPMKSLAKRFDLSVFTYLGQVSGDLKLPMSFFSPTLKYQRTLELLFEISNAQILAKPIKRMLDELEEFLRTRNLVTDTLLFSFYYRYNDGIDLTVQRAGGEYKAERWLALLSLQLETVKLSEPVVTIRLVSQKLAPFKARESDLFSNKNSRLEPDELLSQLVAKLGGDAVTRLVYNDCIAPEAANAQCLTNGECAKKDNFISSIISLRPSFLQAMPSPLKETVTLLHGPERILTNWWESELIYRDYFIANNKRGQWLWVYRTPDQDWFVQGVFA